MKTRRRTSVVVIPVMPQTLETARFFFSWNTIGHATFSAKGGLCSKTHAAVQRGRRTMYAIDAYLRRDGFTNNQRNRVVSWASVAQAVCIRSSTLQCKFPCNTEDGDNDHYCLEVDCRLGCTRGTFVRTFHDCYFFSNSLPESLPNGTIWYV